MYVQAPQVNIATHNIMYTNHVYGVGRSGTNMHFSDPCTTGDIRLWGEGNIELCNGHGVWSAVYDNNWDWCDATVACRQLNYTNFSKVIFSYPHDSISAEYNNPRRACTGGLRYLSCVCLFVCYQSFGYTVCFCTQSKVCSGIF